MNKALLAMPLAAVLAVSLVIVPAIAAPSYTQVESSDIRLNPEEVEYKVKTDGVIPMEADGYINSLPLTVLGFGWLDTASATEDGIPGVFATIHPAFTDSTFATGDKWHAHTGIVKPQGDILCLVYLASPNFDLKIDGDNELEQQLASTDATITSTDLVSSFNLQVNGDCPSVEVPLVGILNLEVVAPSP